MMLENLAAILEWWRDNGQSASIFFEKTSEGKTVVSLEMADTIVRMKSDITSEFEKNLIVFPTAPLVKALPFVSKIESKRGRNFAVIQGLKILLPLEGYARIEVHPEIEEGTIVEGIEVKRLVEAAKWCQFSCGPLTSKETGSLWFVDWENFGGVIGTDGRRMHAVHLNVTARSIVLPPFTNCVVSNLAGEIARTYFLKTADEKNTIFVIESDLMTCIMRNTATPKFQLDCVISEWPSAEKALLPVAPILTIISNPFVQSFSHKGNAAVRLKLGGKFATLEVFNQPDWVVCRRRFKLNRLNKLNATLSFKLKEFAEALSGFTRDTEVEVSLIRDSLNDFVQLSSEDRIAVLQILKA